MSYPITHLAVVIERIGAKLDLRSVISQRYGKRLETRGNRWACECFLPSTVDGFAGSCAEQDAAATGGDRPLNLWVSIGTRTLVWRCHSCGRHGDVIDLIGYADDVPRMGVRVGLGAVRRAAELAGLGWIMDGEPGPRAGRDNPNVDLALVHPVTSLAAATPNGPTINVTHAHLLLAQVCEFYRKQLADPSNAHAIRVRALLASRGIGAEQIDVLGLGLACPPGDRLVSFIRARDRTGGWLDLALQLGLVRRKCSCGVKGCDGEHPNGVIRWLDAQRERVVFPYVERDDGGVWRVTGFAGRSLLDDLGVDDMQLPANAGGKWLNSNTSDVWSKKSALLGLALLAPDDSRCVVSEGGMDVAAWHRAEVPAVAPVGVGFSVAHATVLQRYGIRAVTICFDSDPTGRLAVLPALGSLLAAGFAWNDLHVIDLPDGHDPDELPIDDLQRLYDAPLTPVEFVERHEELLKAHASRFASAVALAPGEDRDHLRELLVLPATAPDPIEASPGQALVRELLACPGAAAFVAADDVRKLLVNEPHLHDSLASLTFADATDFGALGPSIAELLLKHEKTELLAQHDALNDGPEFAPGDWLAAAQWADDASERQHALMNDVARIEKRLRAIGSRATLEAQ